MSINAEAEAPDVAAGFAAMMNEAAAQAGEPDAEAPYGWTTDPATGEPRPKKAPGRPRKSPPVEELKAQREAAPGDDGAGPGPAGDRAPDESRRNRRKTAAAKTEDKARPAPPAREGTIAKGINRLYRKAGKMVKIMDPDVGQALIDITRKDEDDDITVGEAWEELAKANPRVRAFCMRIISGGAWGQLLMAHVPVVVAVLTKDAIRRRLPLGRIMDAFLTPDNTPGGDGEAPAQGTPFEGMTMGDMAAMQALAEQAIDIAMHRGGTHRAPPRPPGPAVTAAGPAASGS